MSKNHEAKRVDNKFAIKNTVISDIGSPCMS